MIGLSTNFSVFDHRVWMDPAMINDDPAAIENLFRHITIKKPGLNLGCTTYTHTPTQQTSGLKQKVTVQKRVCEIKWGDLDNSRSKDY